MRLDALAPAPLAAYFPPGPSGNVGQSWLAWPGARTNGRKSTAWGPPGGASPHSSLSHSSGTPRSPPPPLCSAGGGPPGCPPLHPSSFIPRSGCHVGSWAGLSVREDPTLSQVRFSPRGSWTGPMPPGGCPRDHTQPGRPGGLLLTSTRSPAPSPLPGICTLP